MTRARLWRAAVWTGFVLLVVFAARLFVRVLGELAEARVHPSALLLVASVLVLVVARLLDCEGWHRLMAGFGRDRIGNVRVFTVAELFRYLPGGVAHFGARYRLARAEGVAPADVVALSTVDLALRLGVGVLSFVVAISVWPGVPRQYVWLALVLLPALAAAASPAVVGRCLALAQRKLNREVTPVELSQRTVVGASAWFTVSSLARGAAVWLALAAVTPMTPRDVVPVTGAAALAWVVGVVVPFAPGGLGVREATAVALLVTFVTLDVATFAALFSRAGIIVAEFVVAGAVAAAARGRRTPADDPIDLDLREIAPADRTARS